MELQKMIDQQQMPPISNVLKASKLPTVNTEKPEKIGEMLMYLYKLTGIPVEKYPDPMVLNSYIRSNLGHYSLLDFINAFNLAISKRLDLSENDVNPYGNFSTLYVARIMESYHRFRFRVIEDNRKSEIEKQNLNVVLSEEEKHMALYKWAQGAYDVYLSKGMFLNLGPLYERLKKAGIIQFSDEREIELRQEADKLIFPKGTKIFCVSDGWNLLNRSTPEDSFQYHALTVFFDELRARNTTLAELFDLVPQAV